tara:strand:- start:723 stop:938 length:216 start_codon:yes stop_codon:yes gene_type:complete
MANPSEYLDLLREYVDAFPDAVMFDSRGMAGEDFDRIDEMMQAALDRGSPMVASDLKFPVSEPDPETGLVL